MRPVITVNGEAVPLPMDDELPPGGFAEFVRYAETEELVAVLGRVYELAIRAGCSDQEADKAVCDVQEQIAVIRGLVEVH